ncbi:hypothetical protein C8R41DRAFT_821877 [Lentinula lateritia]|uniref:Uncharacterized protein n=1 Tax=Lentinula lateritia TaxID=40482 RepID=A0ABQ8VMM4_9AGAR|nr:hypothetical protein C8R41DRAFT_821877 [Lentinula lateritia]
MDLGTSIWMTSLLHSLVGLCGQGSRYVIQKLLCPYSRGVLLACKNRVKLWKIVNVLQTDTLRTEKMVSNIMPLIISFNSATISARSLAYIEDLTRAVAVESCLYLVAIASSFFPRIFITPLSIIEIMSRKSRLGRTTSLV